MNQHYNEYRSKTLTISTDSQHSSLCFILNYVIICNNFPLCTSWWAFSWQDETLILSFSGQATATWAGTVWAEDQSWERSSWNKITDGEKQTKSCPSKSEKIIQSYSPHKLTFFFSVLVFINWPNKSINFRINIWIIIIELLNFSIK